MLPRTNQLRHEDAYLRVLCVALACYAVVGKGFAYLGVPPLFVGEVLLLAGLWLWAGTRFAGLNAVSAAQLLLIAFMIWGALLTVPGMRVHGVDALRDAVVWGYGLFALVVSGLLVARPQRLAALLGAFARFTRLFLVLAPFAFVIGMWGGHFVPELPLSGMPVFGPYKTSDAMVHLTGIFAFLAVSAGPGVLRAWMLALAAVNLMLNFNGRAGLVAFACGVAVVWALRPLNRLAVGMCAAAASALLLLWVTGVSIQLPSSGRALSFEQFTENVRSITRDSDREELSGSRRWRLEWWGTILDYTLHGRYFWTGKGFGINLANADGFQVHADESLRSPHNGHLTILARAGVPGFALWAATQIAWALGLFDAFVRAARAREQRWAGLFVFLLAYWVAFMVNIGFDVYLEGPVGGIWFWTVFGVGLAAVRIHRVSPEVLGDSSSVGKAWFAQVRSVSASRRRPPRGLAAPARQVPQPVGGMK